MNQLYKAMRIISIFGIVLTAVFIAGLFGKPLSALNPTIINGNVILCPGGQEILATQEYDTYQWYKNGNLIPGATQQTHVVDYYNDVGSTFSVFVTQGAQSAMSPSILVDGWLFSPLVVSNYGQGFWFTPDVGWEMCEYHELYFEVMLPYHTNIQWYKNGMPIFGANHPVYRVLETGVYAVSGSPEICPDYVQYSIDLPVIVHVPPKPVISQSADTLFTSVFPGQWYAGDGPIPGATGQYLIPDTTGWYSFEFTDVHGCKKMSDPFFYEWDPVGITVPPVDFIPSARVAGNKLIINSQTEANYEIYSITGSMLAKGKLNLNQHQINISQLTSGLYLIRIMNERNYHVLKFAR
jgi:hypothetical protein